MIKQKLGTKRREAAYAIVTVTAILFAFGILATPVSSYAQGTVPWDIFASPWRADDYALQGNSWVITNSYSVTGSYTSPGSCVYGSSGYVNFKGSITIPTFPPILTGQFTVVTKTVYGWHGYSIWVFAHAGDPFFYLKWGIGAFLFVFHPTLTGALSFLKGLTIDVPKMAVRISGPNGFVAVALLDTNQILSINVPTDGTYTIQYVNIGGSWLCQYYSYGPIGGGGGPRPEPMGYGEA